MGEQEFSPLRSKASRKPWPHCPDIIIYQCNRCATTYQNVGYLLPTMSPVCCHTTMEQLKPLQAEDVLPDIQVSYQIVGGYNKSAVQVFWEKKQPEDKPEWIVLKTFTGSYIKYMTEKKQPPMIFPLADEDAYVYCDEQVCLKCVFRCKRGFIIYMYFKTKGLVELPLDEMHASY